MSQLGNHMICSTNKKTAGLLMGQLGNHMICSTNKKQQIFEGPIENSSFFDRPIRKPHDLFNQ